MEWQPRQVREREDLCTNTEKDQSLVKLLEEPTTIQNSSRDCDCGKMASNAAGRPGLSGGQCCSDEVLLHQVRRNGEAAIRTTKRKVCVSCRAMWARSTAMKCFFGGTAHAPAAERGVAYHQKCVRIGLLLASSIRRCAAHHVSSPMRGA